jgi:general secretion pathway protein L
VLILQPAANDAPATPASVVDWVRTPDTRQTSAHGQSALNALPGDPEVVLVLPAHRVSWHRVDLPRVGTARLRAALDGLLEERLLGDTERLHFALEPGGRAGQSLWVAACDKGWLRQWLKALDDAGRTAVRVAPVVCPLRAGEPVWHWVHPLGERVWITSASPWGVSGMPLQQHHASLWPQATEADHWSADPSVAAQAEQALDRRLALLPWPAALLRAAQSEWNLAQFDLSLSGGARRSQRLKQVLRQWASAPAWGPARWGMGALVLSLLIGLNALAWAERQSLASKEKALGQTLQRSFPEERLVLDAPLQMQRALARLQQASGQLSGGDLETALSAMAGAPLAATPRTIEFDPGDTRFGDWGVPDTAVLPLQRSLQAQGWQAHMNGGVLRLRPPAP